MKTDAINYFNFGKLTDPIVSIDLQRNVSVFLKASFESTSIIKDCYIKVSEIKGFKNSYCLTIRNTLDDITDVTKEVKLYLTTLNDYGLLESYDKHFKATLDIERSDTFAALVRVTLKRHVRALQHKLKTIEDATLEKELRFLTVDDYVKSDMLGDASYYE